MRARWITGSDRFFLPFQVLSRVFRGKFLEGLRKAHRRVRLRFPGKLAALADSAQFNRLLSQTVQTEWVVHAKRPTKGPATVLKYLARYTHKTAISNRRLLDLTDGQVTFRWKDYAHGGRRRVMTLDAIEFVRRFLMHVLPSGFVRIRHYGMLANCHRREKLARCRELLGAAPPTDSAPPVLDATPEPGSPVTPTRVCPKCGGGRMIVIEQLPPTTLAEGSLVGSDPCLILDSS